MFNGRPNFSKLLKIKGRTIQTKQAVNDKIVLVLSAKDRHKKRLRFTGDTTIWKHLADRNTADPIAVSVIHCIERVLKSELALRKRKDSRFADLLNKAKVYIEF